MPLSIPSEHNTVKQEGQASTLQKGVQQAGRCRRAQHKPVRNLSGHRVVAQSMPGHTTAARSFSQDRLKMFGTHISGDVCAGSPMGLMSALEQSYLVRYPRRPSSTLALPSTKKKPLLQECQKCMCMEMSRTAHISSEVRVLRLWRLCTALTLSSTGTCRAEEARHEGIVQV